MPGAADRGEETLGRGDKGAGPPAVGGAGDASLQGEAPGSQL